MSATQVVRLKSLRRCGPALVNHVLGRVRPDTALPRLWETRPIILAADPAAIAFARRLIARQTHGKRGRPPHEALSILVAGPPPYCHQDPGWPETRGLEYLDRAMDWFVRELGTETRFVAAVHHRDEGSPHLHCLAVVVVDGILGWSRVRDRMSTGGGEGTRYGSIQTRFHQEVASVFGLARGQVGSRAVQQRPDRAVALAMRELRLRQIHVWREAARLAGEAPYGQSELLKPEPWERALAATMDEVGDAARVARLKRIARVPGKPPLAVAPPAPRSTTPESTPDLKVGGDPRWLADLLERRQHERRTERFPVDGAASSAPQPEDDGVPRWV